MSGTRSRNCLPAICQVGPRAAASGSSCGTRPRRIVTCGASPGAPAIKPGSAISLATESPEIR